MLMQLPLGKTMTTEMNIDPRLIFSREFFHLIRNQAKITFNTCSTFARILVGFHPLNQYKTLNILYQHANRTLHLRGNNSCKCHFPFLNLELDKLA